MKKSINDITLFRYLFCLDNRDLPQSILNWCKNIGSVVEEDSFAYWNFFTSFGHYRII